MIEVKEKLEIPLDHINDQMKMIIYPNMKGENLLLIEDDYKRYNEAKFQVFEGKKYLYELINAGNWFIDTEKAAGTFTKIKDGDIGGFNPNTFVGTFQIPFIHRLTQEIKYEFIEIRSTKISYEKGISDSDFQSERSEYQEMVKDIAEQSIDLVLQYNIPIQQSYESGLEQLDDEKQLYQRFLFVRSLFKNEEFEEAVQKIISNPATKWETELEARDVRSIRRFTPKNIRELVSGPNRMNLSSSIGDLKSIPTKISSNRKVESVDTPENRFIKHILTSFQDFCEAILPKLTRAKLTRESEEVQSFAQRLDNLLNQPFFKEINRPNSLKLNSPVLQRRSGYRELLRAWLRFHVTAQLSWNPENEENLFAGGKKDIASLYEYWVFFVLFELLSENYGKNTTKDPNQLIDGLIVPDKHGLALTLQEGKKRAFKFTHRSDKRNLNIQFYYNRSFVGGKAYDKDKSAGSYSKAFRPDYTLSIWPSDLSQTMAEETESIVHIHFDAKYKVEYSFLKEEKPEEGEEIIVADSENLSDEEKQSLEEERASASINVREKEEKKGIYKNVDLYKMHAYKDAIRRSGGAYILYPGNAKDNKEFKGFHEIIPGVGAFALRPNNEGQASENIQKFIEKVIKNLEDVLSQRERMARSTKKVYAETYHSHDAQLDNLIRQLGTSEIPDETHVLVGYCKDEKHRKWISGDSNNMRYNIRFGEGYEVNGKMAAAQYLILYSGKDFLHQEIYRIKPASAKIISKEDMKKLNYDDANHSLYFVFELAEKINLDATYRFDKQSAILKGKLADLKSNFRPFTLNLMELSKIRLKKV